jgi:hypothetical protein
MGGVYLYASSDGTALGLQLVSYMLSIIYVADGVSTEQLRKLLDANSKEVGHQAE